MEGELSNGEHILMCISDLEGCLETSAFLKNKNDSNLDANVTQSTVLCEDKTFQKIKEQMEKNTNLQVVFCGDYFDKGPHMASSIKGIAELCTTFNIDVERERVHVILGNRDVNKKRIFHESKAKLENYVIQKGNWLGDPDWTKLESDDAVTKTQHLLLKTYGAPNLLEYMTKEGIAENEQGAIDIFGDIFSDKELDRDTFANHCRILFQHGKLIKLINVGTTTVLASHSGANNLNMFKLTSIDQLEGIDDIIEKYKTGEYSYFQVIHEIQKLLGSTSVSNTENITESIDFYNKLLDPALFATSEVVNERLPGIPEDNYREYFLLQAMGMPEIGNQFLSPIQACGLKGCTGITPLPTDLYDFLVKNEKQSVNVIVHGHKPHCSPVPIMHREGVIGFLHLDQSNNNRPKECGNVEITLEKTPIGFIQDLGGSNYKMGITSVTNVLESTDNDRVKGVIGCDNNGTEEEFQPMVTILERDNIPLYDEKDNKINYADGSFKFNDNGPFFPTRFISRNVGFTTGMLGGKRKTKKSKKTRKPKRSNKRRSRKQKSHRKSRK